MLMCGIVGIYGHPDAVELTRLGLYSLQHRGQESAGLVVVDDKGQAHAYRSLGLVADGLGKGGGIVSGHIAIGHTRYSTTGSTTIENAQPALARFRGGHIALAHNGNITNASELRLALEERGSIFSSTMDSEVLVHRLAMSPAEIPADKLADALQGVEGAYCLVIAMGTAMLAARDPRGWRPLVLGTLDEATVIASETCALDIMGAHYVREIEPGEILEITANGLRSIFPLARLPLRRCVFEHVYFSRPDSIVFGGSVEASRRALGRRLAKECPAPGAELVFSVPGLIELGCAGLCRSLGVTVRVRPDPQSLRRPHVHSAHAGRPGRQGQGQIQRRSAPAGWEASRHGRRLDCARDNDAGSGDHDPLGRCAGSAHARQLCADHRTVLLRHRYPEPRGADRCKPDGGSDRGGSGGGFAGIPVTGRDARIRAARAERILPRLFLRRLPDASANRPR